MMCDKLREYLKEHLKKKLNVEIIDDDKGNLKIVFALIKFFCLFGMNQLIFVPNTYIILLFINYNVQRTIYYFTIFFS